MINLAKPGEIVLTVFYSNSVKRLKKCDVKFLQVIRDMTKIRLFLLLCVNHRQPIKRSAGLMRERLAGNVKDDAAGVKGSSLVSHFLLFRLSLS